MASPSKATTLIALLLALNILLVFCFQSADASSPSPNSSKSYCNPLSLGVVCGDLLGGLLGDTNANPSNTKPCCGLVEDLVDLEATVCVYVAIKANVLGINLNIPRSLDLLLNACGKQVPPTWQLPG